MAPAADLSTLQTIVLLLGAGVVAGAMNAMAGGGTFVAFPALLATGMPQTVANATSNTALLPGALASAWTYRKSFQRIGPLPLKAMVAITLLGGAAGAWLLSLTGEAAFRVILPWLLLAASLVLTFGRSLRHALERRQLGLGPIGAAVLQFLLGAYGGYFGGAVGLLMMATWALISDHSVIELAPMRTLLLGAANAAASVLFTLLGLVVWTAALPLAAGSIVGGYLGAILALRLPASWVRVFTLAVSYLTTAAFFLRG